MDIYSTYLYNRYSHIDDDDDDDDGHLYDCIYYIGLYCTSVTCDSSSTMTQTESYTTRSVGSVCFSCVCVKRHKINDPPNVTDLQ